VPLSRRQIYRRRRTVVFGTLAIVLAVAFYLPTTLLAPLPQATAQLAAVKTPSSTVGTITLPSYGASAIGAVGFDGLLATGGSSAQLPMASISKLITMLVVLEAKPLKIGQSGPAITLGATDVANYSHYLALNGTVAPVRVGVQLSELQMMQTAVIPSANNYAASIASWAYGSEATFLTAAQAWLKKNGLTGITYVEPTGIDPGNTATATDLVALGKLAVANPVIASITSTKKITIPGVGKLENTNKLLGLRGVTGLKTGTLDPFGANLLYSATERVGTSAVTLIGVVLGAKSHPVLDKDLKNTLVSATSAFHDLTLTTAGEKFGSYSTAWGQSDLVATRARSIVVFSKTPVSMAVSARKVAIGGKGTDVGAVTFTVGAKTITVPLELASTVAEPGPVWRLSHPAALL
jgi:D-alanyl-D-alanine carboxypeptidase (penicillin-binding protein 5/6)